MSQSRLARLPPWVSHWLGYRAKPVGPLPMWKTNAWSFVSAFAGLTVVQVLFNYSHYFTSRHVPGIIASYVGPHRNRSSDSFSSSQHPILHLDDSLDHVDPERGRQSTLDPDHH